MALKGMSCMMKALIPHSKILLVGIVAGFCLTCLKPVTKQAYVLYLADASVGIQGSSLSSTCLLFTFISGFLP